MPGGTSQWKRAPGPAAGERVLVAMSGGVDSSLAAALMRESGCEVVGVNLQFSRDPSGRRTTTHVEDARRVAETLGIRLCVEDCSDRFRREVIEVFADAYVAGHTPIPCVTCNTNFKFAYLLDRAQAWGSRWVVTGHYARRHRDPDSGQVRLHRAADRNKDQTYFLFQLDQKCLSQVCFPLGELTKPAVRARAAALGLATANKPESREICFVSEPGYADLVEAIRPAVKGLGGDIVDEQGRVLGHHSGVHRFTVGQRRGLAIHAGRRLYVTGIDASRRRVVVGQMPSLYSRGAEVEDVRWAAGEAPRRPLRAGVQVRYRHAPAAATIEPDVRGGARVRFDEPVRAVTPGQAAVFYEDDVVVGGGWIARALRAGSETSDGEGVGRGDRSSGGRGNGEIEDR